MRQADPIRSFQTVSEPSRVIVCLVLKCTVCLLFACCFFLTICCALFSPLCSFLSFSFAFSACFSSSGYPQPENIVLTLQVKCALSRLPYHPLAAPNFIIPRPSSVHTTRPIAPCHPVLPLRPFLKGVRSSPGCFVVTCGISGIWSVTMYRILNAEVYSVRTP